MLRCRPGRERRSLHLIDGGGRRGCVGPSFVSGCSCCFAVLVPGPPMRPGGWRSSSETRSTRTSRRWPIRSTTRQPSHIRSRPPDSMKSGWSTISARASFCGLCATSPRSPPAPRPPWSISPVMGSRSTDATTSFRPTQRLPRRPMSTSKPYRSMPCARRSPAPASCASSSSTPAATIRSSSPAATASAASVAALRGSSRARTS